MKKRARKNIRVISGIISAFYFLFPFIYETGGKELQDSSLYEWFFVPEWIYNYFSPPGHNRHLMAFAATLLAGIALWICLFYIFLAIYDIYLDIYLNKKRFEEDVEGD